MLTEKEDYSLSRKGIARTAQMSRYSSEINNPSNNMQETKQ